MSLRENSFVLLWKAVLLPPQKEGEMGGDNGFTLYSGEACFYGRRGVLKRTQVGLIFQNTLCGFLPTGRSARLERHVKAGN